jgi:hypothetical protein
MHILMQKLRRRFIPYVVLNLGLSFKDALFAEHSTVSSPVAQHGIIRWQGPCLICPLHQV